MTTLQEAAQRALSDAQINAIISRSEVREYHPGAILEFAREVIAAALANEPQAEPVRKLTYEDADEIPCPHCGGAGTETSLSGGGPDAYDVEHDCSHCAGNQTLGAAYRTLIQDLKAARKAHTEACARLYAAPPAEQPEAVGLSDEVVTWQQAVDAIEDMDDYARMMVGVDPSGPRECLYRFIEQTRAALAAAQPVAAGWKWVPADPTEAMLSAGYEAGLSDADAWSAMLEAAPEFAATQGAKT